MFFFFFLSSHGFLLQGRFLEGRRPSWQNIFGFLLPALSTHLTRRLCVALLPHFAEHCSKQSKIPSNDRFP
jgi:hypothetical protein